MGRLRGWSFRIAGWPTGGALVDPLVPVLIALTGACIVPSLAPTGDAMSPQLAADVSLVRGARIFFLHQSVGANVLEGVERLDVEVAGPKLRMVTLPAASTVAGPAVVHGSGGDNAAPTSKIDFFARAIAEAPGLAPELAFLKLCYVDVDPATDVDALFAHYRHTLRGLAVRYPEIRFAHVTVPLTTSGRGLKSALRRFLGLPVWQDAANVKRSAFNERLKAEFADAPIFDLAHIESTGPDGVSSFVWNAHSYPCLDASYTNDGGHLNATGERVVAAAWLRFVAAALRERRASAR